MDLDDKRLDEISLDHDIKSTSYNIPFTIIYGDGPLINCKKVLHDVLLYNKIELLQEEIRHIIDDNINDQFIKHLIYKMEDYFSWYSLSKIFNIVKHMDIDDSSALTVLE